MVRVGIINQIIKDFKIDDIEKHLIYYYIIKFTLSLKKNSILIKYFKKFEINKNILERIEYLEIQTIKDLEKYLELLIPKDDRKLNGAFFTPDFIINYIINELKPRQGDLNLDPSCGCGAFLVGLTEYYKTKYKKPIKSIIKENIFGSDILEYNIRRSKLILTLYALQHNENLSDDDFNLYNQDSLRAHWKQKFDIIVGNPPYVKFQDLSDANRNYLVKKWNTIKGGTYNLYFVFFELGYNLLTEKGKLGYITPNNYFTSLAGESLREYFEEKRCIYKIVDFSHKKVFDAQTYTAISFINKSNNLSIKYDRLPDQTAPENFLNDVKWSINTLKDLSSKKWRLLKSDEKENIRNIENIGTHIGELFDINVGIATLKDEVFFVDGAYSDGKYYKKTRTNKNFLIEKNCTRQLYKISDFKNQSQIQENKRRVIFPYKIKKGIAIPYSENEFKSEFPKCYEYLLDCKEILNKRDKGKVVYNPFFIWGRTQGITKRGKKLLTPTFSQYPRFLLVEDEDAYYTNGYGIYFKEITQGSLFSGPKNLIACIENIDIVQKILNSDVMHYYIKKTSVSIEGGYPCYQKNFIEKFTIPIFNEKEILQLRKAKNKKSFNDILIKKYQLSISVSNLSE